MYVKVEPTGCCVRKGLVQIRLSMYLDINDYGYAKHHVQVSVIPEEVYKGDLSDLPKVWQNNPFHNHFIFAEPDITDKEILDIAEEYLKKAFSFWEKDQQLSLECTPVIFDPSPSAAKLFACNEKVQYLRTTELIRLLA